ncbi:MAG: hypothetical protein IT514_13930, partial [Burkholderiales bacterium]|nr:hypothetical protein [Burkholderiales bacterium]
ALATGNTVNSSCTFSVGSPCAKQIHTLFGPASSTPPVLPVSGFVNYTFVNGTRPTDSLGNAAAAAPAVQFAADFTNQKVGVNIPSFTVNSNTWSASSSGGVAAPSIPVRNSLYFDGALNVTTSLPGATAGMVSGIFTGNHAPTPTPSANGSVPGVMMGYSLNAGGFGGTTVTGASVFKKP